MFGLMSALWVSHVFGFIAIGDVMIMSDIIIACLSDSGAPLLLLREKRILAANGEAFFGKLIDGPILG
jgi:hypothetical protein